MSDNIVQFPGNDRKPEGNVQYGDQFDITVNISWEDYPAIELDESIFTSDIAQDAQLLVLRQKLDDLYDLVKENTDMCQFVSQQISRYTNHMQGKSKQ